MFYCEIWYFWWKENAFHVVIFQVSKFMIFPHISFRVYLLLQRTINVHFKETELTFVMMEIAHISVWMCSVGWKKMGTHQKIYLFWAGMNTSTLSIRAFSHYYILCFPQEGANFPKAKIIWIHILSTGLRSSYHWDAFGKWRLSSSQRTFLSSYEGLWRPKWYFE